MSAEQAEALRYLYGTLATICATGFVATLRLRWSVLRRGEKILRAALVGEHLTISYGAYVAIKYDYPATQTGLILSLWLFGVIVGFAVWIFEDILPGDINMRRLTD